MNISHEIETLDTEIASADHAAAAVAELRRRREALLAAQAAEAEARHREQETREAARAVEEAEAAAKRAEIAPLRDALAKATHELATIDVEVTAAIRRALADARELYQRYLAVTARQRDIGDRLAAAGDPRPIPQALAFEAFVLERLRRFDAAGRSAAGAEWSR